MRRRPLDVRDTLPVVLVWLGGTVLVSCHHLVELLVDVAGSVAGFSELGSLGEGLA